MIDDEKRSPNLKIKIRKGWVRLMIGLVLLAGPLLFFVLGLSVMHSEPAKVSVQTLEVAEVVPFEYRIVPTGKPSIIPAQIAPAGVVTFKNNRLVLMACDPCHQLAEQYPQALRFNIYAVKPAPKVSNLKPGELLAVYVPDEQGSWWLHPEAKGWFSLALFFFLVCAPIVLLLGAGNYPQVQRLKTPIALTPLLLIVGCLAWVVFSAG
jgi:hypothetical protein